MGSFVRINVYYVTPREVAYIRLNEHVMVNVYVIVVDLIIKRPRVQCVNMYK